MNILNDLLSQPVQPSPAKKQRRSIEIKSQREISIMRQAGKIVATVLKEISEMVQPGMTTLDLDRYAEKRIREMDAIPSLKGYRGFPATLCTSINNEAVHGIPSHKRVIRSGDVLKVDTCAYYQGFHGDSCITIAIDEVSAEAAKFIRVAQEALYKGVEQVKAGNYLMDIAGAVQDHVTSYGYSIVEDFTGHGVGRTLHEEPCVFFFRTRELPNVKLRSGMTLTIEPILCAGSKETRLLPDGWTVITADDSLSAQFEHTVLVTQDGCEILTDRTQL
ncbi:type I methionyl aminopeptidase [Allocoleopsis franciscana]|uniref:Methionine aminopeptidase n=1 Tax=Allocoleopsis franciscana PCC 7113 TaxID=1173027 RepID=K9WJU3_9CYAN|nr:type I methionyl aminopeptidase [Allocoleopsis franciscana]AFZ20468.1 methionine aminopeptidase, type I [Allocoleopsis franciscana PCC 7113]